MKPKYCSQHPLQKMTLLFTSWVCDICDPPTEETTPIMPYVWWADVWPRMYGEPTVIDPDHSWAAERHIRLMRVWGNMTAAIAGFDHFGHWNIGELLNVTTKDLEFMIDVLASPSPRGDGEYDLFLRRRV